VLDIDRIRQLVDMMVTNDLVELSLRDGDLEVNLRRPTGSVGEAPVVMGQPVAMNPVPGAGVQAPGQPAPAAEEEDGKTVEINSPMVGTFYAAPDPDSPPYVRVGSRVNPDTVVCIVEAMKVFNEIKAEVSGTIEKILVKNEQPIEYGQPLFQVRPE
jgi:acetyl-CoA carboxylase biotin carboxyl carrier protein